MKVGIGTPHISEYCHSKFCDDLTGMIALSLNRGVEIVRQPSYREQTTFARNKISNDLINKADVDYVLFVDDDMTFAPDLLVKLLSRDIDIVSALTFIRRPPHEPSMYNLNNDGTSYDPIFIWHPKALVKCDAVGMAATLIKREVFETLRPVSQLHKGLHGFFEGYAEDLNFCRKATDNGHPVYCDTSLLVGHITQSIIGFGDFAALEDMKMYNIKKFQAEKKYGADMPTV